MPAWGHQSKKGSTLALATGAAFLFLGLGIGEVSHAVSGYTPQPKQMVAEEKAPGTEGVGITEKLGSQVDLSLEVTNEKGETKTLGSYFSKGHPVVLSMVYYTCPGLCNFHLNGLYESMKGVDWTPGQNFEMLALSFDPKDKFTDAATKRESYLKILNRPGAEAGVHFLTATPATVAEVTKEVGFEYKWDERAKDWAHASAAIMLSPEGKITRYLHGIIFEPKDLKLGLQEASSGKIGSIVDKMVWYCYMYDPKSSKYALAGFRLVQLGGAAIILVIAGLLIPQWLKSRQPRV